VLVATGRDEREGKTLRKKVDEYQLNHRVRRNPGGTEQGKKTSESGKLGQLRNATPKTKRRERVDFHKRTKGKIAVSGNP